MNVTELKDTRTGEDVFVIGSGNSLQYIAKAIFYDSVTIGVNAGWSHHLDAVDYLVTKYHALAMGWKDSPRVGHVVVTRGTRGHHHGYLKDHPELYLADHNDNPVERFTLQDWPKHPDHLVASHSSITTAMHLAAYMGARRIFVVGADCGVIDGEMNVKGHDRKQTTLETLQSFDRQNAMVKAALEERYDTHVLSVSPWVTPNMTGHRFESYAGVLDAR